MKIGYILVILVAMLVVGCAMTPETQRGYDVMLSPETPEQYVTSAYGLYAWVGSTAALLYKQGTIGRERLKAVQETLGEVRPKLDRVSQLVLEWSECRARGGALSCTPVPQSRLEWLRAAQSLLVGLQQRLEEQIAESGHE